jgi:RNA polymerase sigma-70 factor (ECF subfamily)
MQKQEKEADNIPIAMEDFTKLVHFCTSMTKNKDSAEDLAQEAILIAINNISMLREPERRQAWLFGIARNVCLRWLRAHGRDNAYLVQPHSLHPGEDPALSDPEESVADEQDVELVLERKELIELLDRALALLPPQTRTVLIQRYVEDSPLAEIAAELGTNASAVAMRLRRGKLILRRILTQEMRDEMALYTPDGAMADWEVTPLWCSICGRQRFLGQRDPVEGKLLLKCPLCSPDPDELLNKNYLPALKGIRSYKPLYSRLAAWCDLYYRSGLETGSAACIRCGRIVPVFIQAPENFSAWMRNTKDMRMWMRHPDDRYVTIACEQCASASVTSLEALILESSAGQQFLQAHTRIRTLPSQHLEYNGRAALLTRFESITNTASLEVISDYETYEIITCKGTD